MSTAAANSSYLGASVLPVAPCLVHWYALYTYPRHEKRVTQHFAERGIPYFLPLYHVQHLWKDGSNVRLELPLFPGYVFVHIPCSERVRVLEVPGIVSILGRGRIPEPVSALQIESLRAGLQKYKIEPHPYLVVGDRVRICAGVMAGLEGILLRKKNSLRVVITLDVVMQSMALEIDASELELIAPFPRR